MSSSGGSGSSTHPVPAEVSKLCFAEFERAELARLQRAAPEFADIFEAMEAMKRVAEKHGDATTTNMVFVRLRNRLAVMGTRSRAKRADAAIAAMRHYVLHGQLLYRKVLDPHPNAFVGRVGLPVGGLRACWYTGMKYKLTLRKQMMFIHHDGELTGARSSVKDSWAKIGLLVWWPTMERCVRQWVGTSSVFRLSKPQPRFTAEQRRDLRRRPFRVLLMDPMGFVHPPSRGNEVTFHVECPFSRWPWLKAAPVGTAEHGAKFLAEEVFFDLQGSLRCYAVTEAALSSVVSCARSTST